MDETISLFFSLLPLATIETLYMVVASTFFASLCGLPLGILLFISAKGQCKERPLLYKILNGVVNIGRSIPFAILMIALIPVTRLVVGTSLGTTASIVPLTIAAIPFAMRLVETSFKGVDPKLIETALVMGSRSHQIVMKVLLPEAFPMLILQGTLLMINLVGYSAMAGLVGGGGLGSIAIQYGYQRFNGPVMGATVLILILIVQGIQWAGNHLGQSIFKKRGL